LPEVFIEIMCLNCCAMYKYYGKARNRQVINSINRLLKEVWIERPFGGEKMPLSELLRIREVKIEE